MAFVGITDRLQREVAMNIASAFSKEYHLSVKPALDALAAYPGVGAALTRLAEDVVWAPYTTQRDTTPDEWKARATPDLHFRLTDDDNAPSVHVPSDIPVAEGLFPPPTSRFRPDIFIRDLSPIKDDNLRRLVETWYDAALAHHINSNTARTDAATMLGNAKSLNEIVKLYPAFEALLSDETKKRLGEGSSKKDEELRQRLLQHVSNIDSVMRVATIRMLGEGV